MRRGTGTTARAGLGPAVLVAALLGLTGCSNDGAVGSAPDEPRPGDTATDAPTDPPVAITPVVGERIPEAHWVSSSGVLTHRTVEMGSGDTVLPLVHAVGDWLDAHLDDLQRGGDGHLADVAAPDLLTGAAPAELDTVGRDLAAPERPVASATYRLAGSYDAETEWLTATVHVTGHDGETRAATLVFVPTADGPELVLFGPAEVAA